MDFRFRQRGQFDQRGKFHNVGNHDDVDGDLDSIKLKIPNLQCKNDLNVYLEREKKVD
jgi:hypothetical protein